MGSKTLVLNYRALGPTDWISIAETIINDVGSCVIIFVSSHKGSTPRETGTWIVVGTEHVVGTLGGGEIERSAIEIAKEILDGRLVFARKIKQFKLGPDLDQCCGGAMAVLIEPLNQTALEWLGAARSIVANKKEGRIIFSVTETSEPPKLVEGPQVRLSAGLSEVHIQELMDQRPQITVYGAGHVGRAVATICAALPVKILMVDSRDTELAKLPKISNIKTECPENPVLYAKDMGYTDAVLVMTHSHGLDYRLCQTLLEKKGLKYFGLIGSKTKAMKFRRALKLEGKTTQQIADLICPIGLEGPKGKEPGVIAISVLSELLKKIQGWNNVNE